MERLRIDKWLWAARFYKTRSLAAEEVTRGRVTINEQPVKPAREVKVGDTIVVRKDGISWVVAVRALSDVRGPAPAARLLYEETPASIAAREQAAEARRLAPEPAHAIVDGRPTKRGRRELDEASRAWGDRWSASVDEP